MSNVFKLESDKPKKHWFCLVYEYKGIEGEHLHSVYYSTNTKNLTMRVIEDIKEESRLEEESVLTNVSYLGYMTDKEFKNG